MTLFISLCVLTLHLKMVLQNEKIGIYLKLPMLYRFKCMFRKPFGRMLFPQLVFLLIECLPLFLMVRFPTMFFFLQKICFLLLLRYLVVCFVRDVRPHHTKLDPKSLKWIFLGYSRVQKGYRCYCPTLKRYLVSSDVTFFEDTPFISSPSSSC